MIKTFLGLAALSLITIASRAHADPAYDACVNKGVTNYDYTECGAAYLKRADVALNAAWKVVMTQASGQTRTDLLAEQRLWIAFKDKSCLFWANGDWGREGQVLSYAACRGEVIERRTSALTTIVRDISPK